MKTSVIIHGTHNEFTLEQMKACIDLAEKYGGSFRHVVTGLQITVIEKDDKPALIAELPDGVRPVVHRGVNSLIACVGKDGCKNGQMETMELADHIERSHYGRSMAHKCKIGISGCGRNCPDSMIKDIAFVGTTNGFLLVVGGQSFHTPAKGQILAKNLTIEQAKKASDVIIEWYASEAKPKERLGGLLKRVGNPLENITL